MPKFSRVLVSLSVAGLLSGCALAAKPSIPGFDDKVTPPEVFPVARVIAALRCQLEFAFEEINTLKIESLKELSTAEQRKQYETLLQQFRYQTGSISFSGSVQEVRANGTTVRAVIPISGLSGGLLGPDLGGNIGNTNTETISRDLEVTPNIRRSPPEAPSRPDFPEFILPDEIDESVAREYYIREIEAYILALSKHTYQNNEYIYTRAEWEHSHRNADSSTKKPSCDGFRTVGSPDSSEKPYSKDEEKRIKAIVGDFLTNSVVDAFRTSTDNYPSGLIIKGSPVAISDTNLSVTAQFIVTYGIDGGLSPTIPVSTPRLTSISPTATADYDETGTYQVILSLPVVASSSADPRKLIFCTTQTQNEICVEEPYTEHRYDEVIKAEMSGNIRVTDNLELSNKQFRLREIIKDVPSEEIGGLVVNLAPDLEKMFSDSFAQPKPPSEQLSPTQKLLRDLGQFSEQTTPFNVEPQSDAPAPETDDQKKLTRDEVKDQLLELFEQTNSIKPSIGIITPNRNPGTAN